MSCVVVFGGYFIYDNRRRHIDHAAYVERQQQRRKLMDVIELRRWWYIPDASTAEQIYVMVKVNEGGRFSGNAQGREEGTFGNQVFASADVVQRQVAPGEEFTFLFPLTRYREGSADEVSIALYLFKDNAGTAAEDVSIIFTTHPELEDDGHFLYAALPEPD
ncbi:MAG: hypothetical protein HC859_14350 [Bacteroidia bacterium]|nr:hypothetical protein [Bacteroidia bacterium]